VDKIDKDRDGRISYSEVSITPFEAMMKNNQSVIPVIDQVSDELLRNSDCSPITLSDYLQVYSLGRNSCQEVQ
jgi:hypothetical protein